MTRRPFPHRGAVAAMCLLLAVSAQAAERQQVMKWYTHYDCPRSSNTGEPGSSPDLAIAVETFDEPYQSALNAKAQAKATSSSASPYECKWIRITGFLTWLGYYHYRAELLESSWAAYQRTYWGAEGAPTRYIVERFAAGSAPRGRLMQRQVELVGRFYDLCAAADRTEQASNQIWIMVFGPCHYGPGMILTDVVVKQVRDATPQYLLGERNRRIAGNLVRVGDNQRPLLIERVRAWAALVKRGPEAYLAAPASPDDAPMDDDERKDLSEAVRSADSYISHLNALPQFQRLNVERASVEVFWTPDRSDEAVGCICLVANCTDEWPLTSRDARNFLGNAACQTIWKGKSGQWHSY
jgi:hypothetical protein